MLTHRSFVKYIQEPTAYTQSRRNSLHENNKRKRALIILQKRIGNCRLCENAPPQNHCPCGNVYICNECINLCVIYQVRICPYCIK